MENSTEKRVVYAVRVFDDNNIFVFLRNRQLAEQIRTILDNENETTLDDVYEMALGHDGEIDIKNSEIIML